MFTRISIAVAFLLSGLHLLPGQSFQKEYAPANGGFVIPYSATQRPDGKFLVSHMVNDDSVRLYVTCLDTDGAVAWSVSLRAHLNITGNEGFVEGPIAATGDTGCIVMVSKSYQSQVVQQGWAIVKLGPDGKVQWNRQIAGVGLIDDFMEHSGERTFVVARYPPSLYKRYLTCLTDDGTALWEKDLTTSLGTVTVTQTQALSGQRIVLMINTESANLSAGHLVALDDAGNTTNLLSLPDFTFMHVQEHSDGRLFFLGSTSKKVVLGQLQAGQLQWAKVLDVPADLYLSGSIVLNEATNSLAVSFMGTLFKEQRLLMQFDLNGNFLEGHFFPSKEVTANKLIKTLDGGLAWVSFSKVNPLRAFVFVKTQPDGLLSTCPAGDLCKIVVRDTILQPLSVSSWITENVVHFTVRQATEHYQSMLGNDYCAPLPPFNAAIQAADSTGCTGDTFMFFRDSLTTGVSTWVFPQGVPNTFYGPEPPAIAFPDTGYFKVRHILEQAGCIDTAWSGVRIGAKPEVELPPDTLVCPGNGISVTVTGAPDWQYHWSDGTTGATREGFAPGFYTVTATNQSGCSGAASIRIAAVGFPQDPLPANVVSCEGTPVMLDFAVPDHWQYQWADGYPQPGRMFSEAGMYIMLATSPEGCLLADSVRVDITPCPTCFVYFPNIIKPLSGNENGLFGAQSGCNLTEYSLQIFDRWGALIFESTDPAQSWDGNFRGKRALAGVYIYHAKGVLENTGIATPFEKSGSVTIIR